MKTVWTGTSRPRKWRLGKCGPSTRGKAPLCLGVTASALGLGGCVHPLSCSFLGLICACVCADCGNSSEFVDTTAAWRPGLGPDWGSWHSLLNRGESPTPNQLLQTCCSETPCSPVAHMLRVFSSLSTFSSCVTSRQVEGPGRCGVLCPLVLLSYLRANYYFTGWLCTLRNYLCHSRSSGKLYPKK